MALGVASGRGMHRSRQHVNIRLSLRQIKVFQEVMRGGSTIAAAQAMHVSQPAVSKLITSMEEELRYPLFIRSGRGLEPTREAIALYPYAERALAELQRLQSHAQNLRTGSSGLLRIAGNMTLINCLAAQAMSVFREDYPAINVELLILSGAEIQAAVLGNKADIGLIYGPYYSDNIKSERIGSWPVRCVLSQTHPLAAQAEISVRDLSGENLLTYSNTTPTGLAIRRLFENSGTPFNASMVLSNTPGILQMVENGLGVGLVDYWDCVGDPHPDLVSRLLVPRIENLPVMIFSEHSPCNGAMDSMARLIRRLAERMSRAQASERG